jgi:hypothetical protein
MQLPFRKFIACRFIFFRTAPLLLVILLTTHASFIMKGWGSDAVLGPCARLVMNTSKWNGRLTYSNDELHTCILREFGRSIAICTIFLLISSLFPAYRSRIACPLGRLVGQAWGGVPASSTRGTSRIPSTCQAGRTTRRAYS